MIKSMTGFGKFINKTANADITVEIRSLNSKQLDLNARIPQPLKEKEIEIRKKISKILQRGKVDAFVTINNDVSVAPVEINMMLAQKYYSEMVKMSEIIPANASTDYTTLVLKMPDVVMAKDVELDPDIWNKTKVAVEKAVEALDISRKEEGVVLEQDFRKRVITILDLLTKVDQFESKRISNIKERIASNIGSFIKDPAIDSNRLEQEMIYYIEKLDITEEKVRLENNCKYFLENLDNDESSGKKLAFISQEIGREVNTLGSKANDSDLQRIVVLMKDELEKIKEQLFNIL